MIEKITILQALLTRMVREIYNGEINIRLRFIVHNGGIRDMKIFKLKEDELKYK